MQIVTDSFMRIGKGHTICEDYAIAGTNPVPYIILTDGCSSSKNTDVGARILAYCAKQKIERELSIATAIFDADLIRKQLGLEEECLDCTLLVASQTYDMSIRVEVYGDGTIIEVSKEGRIACTEISYTNNAPYYLSYQLNKKRNDVYKQQNNKKYETFKINNKPNITKLERPSDHYTIRNLNSDALSALLLTTDGISTFTDGKYFFDANTIALKLTNFKNTNGAFIQRRCKRMIQNLKKNGHNHLDDFSVGGIYIEGLNESNTDTIDDPLNYDDPCPDCGKQLIDGDNMSGVKCTDENCGYWFCY